ncbi:MAG: trypsin-like peptidase domain-containing protein, partial [Pseudomonadota bacterium]
MTHHQRGQTPEAPLTPSVLWICLAFLSAWISPWSWGADWQTTVDKAAAAVVTIRVDHTRAFDENWNQSTQATGFIVDKERGIILTNRHVVGPGPATATAILLNQEEIELEPLYRDPVHDFGFFRFDPQDVQYLPLSALTLKPGAAQVGTEIRVLGNDAGEQLAILDGTIARLDREAPDYGHGKYNDFNTFYYQAASGSSGGSSGSPVINIQGEVVALNAGSRNRAATSYFLPLYQVVRALQKLRQQEPVLRGSLLTTFTAQPYAQLQKLGLDSRRAQQYRKRFPKSAGMLVTSHVLPGNPVALREGDILLSLNRQPVADFQSLAAILDRHVGEVIEVCALRAGTEHCRQTTVIDLQSVTPTTYIEFDGAVLHQLSYQRARHFNRAVRGIFLADPGFSFSQAGIPKNSLMLELDGQPIDTLDQLQAILEDSYSGQQVLIRYVTLRNNQAVQSATVRLDNAWFPANFCSTGTRGLWSCRSFGLQAARDATDRSRLNQRLAADPGERNPFEQSLVHVAFHMPFPISGHNAGRRTDTGIIVDTQRGWVLVSQSAVPASTGNVFLTFAGQLEVPGQVVALHPQHNLALVAYAPKALAGLPVKAAKMVADRLSPGDTQDIIGLDEEFEIRRQKAVLAELEAVQFPPSNPPRFQNSNTELLQFINGPTDYTGVIVNAEQEVTALWQRFVHRSDGRNRTWHRGVQAAIAIDFLQRVKARQPWFDLGTGWFPTSLSQVRKITPAEQPLVDATYTSLFELKRLTAGTAAATKLQVGDILVNIDNQGVSSLQQIERRTQRPRVNLEILRNGARQALELTTTPRDMRGLQHILLWAGAVIHTPPA